MFSFLVPLLSIITNLIEFLNVFLLERVAIEVIILSCIELRKSLYTIVLENVAHVSYTVYHTNLLDLIYSLSIVETNQMGAYSVLLAIPNVHTFLRNV